MQKHKKFLVQLNEALITYSKDVDIRFNSILKLLKQILTDYVIIFKFMEKLVSMDNQCKQYNVKYQKFVRELQRYNLQNKRNHQSDKNHNVNVNHADQLLAPTKEALAKPQKPTPSSMPIVLSLRNRLTNVNWLLLLAITVDYMSVFDDNATKTGTVNWFKYLTETQISKIEITLLKWKKQTLSDAKSPCLKAVCDSLKQE